jgi:RNA-directed DNA polymerase
MSTTVRQLWLHRLTSCTMSQLAREINPVVRSWVCINYYLVRWLRKKYRRLRAWKKRT